jgi:hypothetical protein
MLQCLFSDYGDQLLVGSQVDSLESYTVIVTGVRVRLIWRREKDSHQVGNEKENSAFEARNERGRDEEISRG